MGLLDSSGEEASAKGGNFLLPENTAIAPEMTTQVGIHLVTPARKIKAMIPSRRILINLPQILTEPHSGIDPLLEDQDEIYVPQIRQTILVTGGVLHPSSFIFRKGFFFTKCFFSKNTEYSWLQKEKYN